MTKQFITISFSILLAFIVLSCSAPQQATQTDVPAAPTPAPKKPDIIVRIGTLNLANLQKRVEKKDIERLAKILKQEQIDVLAVQGIARYPGVKSRVDIVDELSVQTDMRNVFGETINNSGRQNGNGVLSAYPIHSHSNTQYEGIKSANFESALQVAVDGGIRDIVVVSTLLPEKSTADELSSCMKAILKKRQSTLPNAPFFVMGNLPLSESLRKLGQFSEVEAAGKAGKNSGSRMWYIKDGAVKFLSARSIETELGILTTAQFGLFQNAQP